MDETDVTSLLRRLTPLGYADMLRSVAGGVGGQVVGGLRGLGTLATGGGMDRAVANIGDTEQRYADLAKPQTPEGAESLQQAGALMKQVPDVRLPSGHTIGETVAPAKARFEQTATEYPLAGAGALGLASVIGPGDVKTLTRGLRTAAERAALPAAGGAAERGAIDLGPQTVRNPQRNEFSGIYKRPDVLAREAEEQVAPESPLLKQMFGVTRDDLAAIGGSRAGNVEPQLLGAAKNPKGSEAVSNIITPANTQRLVDALGEAQTRAPGLTTGMTGWYVMDPLYQRLEHMFGPEEGLRRFKQLNTLTSMSSPSSSVLTELNRGTAANMLQEQGRFGDFVKYGGGGVPGTPEDMRSVLGHAYHGTSMAPGMEKYLATGAIQSKEPKVPLYALASGVPESGFQTSMPVPDAHFVRGVGLADTRTAQDFGKSASMAESQALSPWWREHVAGQVGLEAVPGQALGWGLFAPQTGVDTAIGVPKLELFAQQVDKAAKRMGVDNETALHMILSGKAHAGVADPALLTGLAAGTGGAAALAAKLRSDAKQQDVPREAATTE